MKMTMYGAGYVGLVTGLCFAELGNDVLIIDVDKNRIENLKEGVLPIFEPGLNELLQRNMLAGRLHFSTDVLQGVAHGLFQFIAVGTPSAADGSADLSYVLQVGRAIGEWMNEYKIIVTKSTVPVGTAEKIKQLVQQTLHNRAKQIDFNVASNPEFLKQGAAVQDFMEPDRIIVGTDHPNALQLLKQLYSPLLFDEQKWLAMDIRSAELTKYVANAYLATRISFINEMSQLAEHLGADINHIRLGIGSDKRIGKHFLDAGCGFGGSCFPKDIRALNKMSEEFNYQSQFLNIVEAVNHQQKQILFNKIKQYFNGDLQNRVIALWGLAFKPNTDDMREASSRIIMEKLWKAGASVRAYDPASMNTAHKIYGERNDLKLCQSAQEALQGADVLAIVTQWDEFCSPDFTAIKQALRCPAIFDGRNLFEPETLAHHGLHYYAIGRGEKIA